MRRKIVVGLVLIFLIFIATAYFVFQNVKVSKEMAFKAIPLNASVIMVFPDPLAISGNIHNSGTALNELFLLPGMKSVDSLFRFITKLGAENDFIPQLFKNSNPLVLSFHPLGGEKEGINLYINLLTRNNFNKSNSLLLDLFENKGMISHRKFAGTVVYDFRPYSRSGYPPFSWSIKHGILVFSSSSQLLEASLTQLSSSVSLESDKAFLAVVKTAGKNVLANAFINFKNSAQPLSFLFSDKQNTCCTWVSHFANWAAADISLFSNKLLLNGFILSSSKNNYINLLINQAPQNYTLESVLPDCTEAFCGLFIESPQKYKSDYLNYLKSLNLLLSYRDSLLYCLPGKDPESDNLFFLLLNNEIALVKTGYSNLDEENNYFFVMKVHDPLKAAEGLMSFSLSNKEVSAKNETKISWDAKKDTIFTVYGFQNTKFFSKLLGPMYEPVHANYFCILNNYLLFGNSIEALNTYAKDILSSNTLSTNLDYKKFSDNLSGNCNFYYFCKYAGIQNFSTKLIPEISQWFTNNSVVMGNVQYLGLQLSSNNDMLYQNTCLQFLDKKSETTLHTQWTASLDTTIAGKVFAIKEKGSGNQFVFVQDVGNRLYQLNSDGKILWKQALSGALMSNIAMVDFFKNGKLQFLCNTKEAIYLIDKLGKMVDSYPKRIFPFATNGLSVYDYDGNKDYRVFLASSDRKVHVYDLKGKEIDGWMFKGAKTDIEDEIQYLKFRAKDYLIVSDKQIIYLLDRKGNQRVQLAEKFVKAENSRIYFENPSVNNTGRLVMMDTSGVFHFIYLDGIVERVDIPIKGKKPFFELADLNGDGDKDFLFTQGKTLYGYTKNKSALFYYLLPETFCSKPIIYYFSKKEFVIAVSSSARNEIAIYFPGKMTGKNLVVKGAVPPAFLSIGNKKCLVSGKDKLVSCYTF
jgi:hypothetical protein